MQPSVPVLVAARNLSVGATIGAGDLAVRNVPPSVVPDSAASRSEAEGKTVAFGPILAGEIIRKEHLVASGSLLAALRTYAPEGWSAVELPPDTATGMEGLRRGDRVELYGEVPYGEKGTVVGLIARAVILQTPEAAKEGSKQYVVAVPANSAPAVAEAVVRNKKLAVVLPSKEEKPGEVSVSDNS